MFENVVVATDASPASSSLVGCVRKLKSLGTRRVVLFHGLGLKHLDAMEPLLHNSVAPTLDQQRAALASGGFEVELAVRPGTPKLEFRSIVDRFHPSLLIVGSQGHPIRGPLRLGSVTLGLLQVSQVPVLVIRLSKDGTSKCGNWGHHVVYATDFSDAAERAFELVRRLVQAGAIASVTLFHAQDEKALRARGAHRLDEFDAIDRERLLRLEHELRTAGGAFVRSEIEHGAPSETIVRRSEESAGAIVVMGTHGRSFLSEMVLGSVSHAVARATHAPVLLVPAPR